jgi:hypothetical protein
MRLNGRNSADGVVTRLLIRKFEVEPGRDRRIKLYSKTFGPNVGCTQPLQWITGFPWG